MSHAAEPPPDADRSLKAYGERLAASVEAAALGEDLQSDAPENTFWAAISDQLMEDARLAEGLGGCEPAFDDEFLGAYADGELRLGDPVAVDLEASLAFAPQTARRLADIQDLSALLRGYAARAEAGCRVDVADATMTAFRHEEARRRFASPRVWAPAAAAAALMLAALTSGALSGLWRPAMDQSAALSPANVTPAAKNASLAVSSIAQGAPQMTPAASLLASAGQGVEAARATQRLTPTPRVLSAGDTPSTRRSSQRSAAPAVELARLSLPVGGSAFLSPNGRLTLAAASPADPYALAPETRTTSYQSRLTHSLMAASQQLLQEIAAQQGVQDAPVATSATAMLTRSETPMASKPEVAAPTDVPAPEDVALSACDATQLPPDATADDAMFDGCGHRSGL